MGFDKKDQAILSVLAENSRLSLRKIAKKCGLGAATVMHRLRELEKNKIVKKYSVELDYDALGFELQAIVEVNVIKGKLFEVEKKIATHPNVSAVYDVTGESDVIIIARFKATKALDKFLKAIQSYDFVTKTKTVIVLNVIKEGHLKF